MSWPSWLHLGPDHKHLCQNVWCQVLELCGCECYVRKEQEEKE